MTPSVPHPEPPFPRGAVGTSPGAAPRPVEGLPRCSLPLVPGRGGAGPWALPTRGAAVEAAAAAARAGSEQSRPSVRLCGQRRGQTGAAPVRRGGPEGGDSGAVPASLPAAGAGVGSCFPGLCKHLALVFLQISSEFRTPQTKDLLCKVLAARRAAIKPPRRGRPTPRSGTLLGASPRSAAAATWVPRERDRGGLRLPLARLDRCGGAAPRVLLVRRPGRAPPPLHHLDCRQPEQGLCSGHATPTGRAVEAAGTRVERFPRKMTTREAPPDGWRGCAARIGDGSSPPGGRGGDPPARPRGRGAWHSSRVSRRHAPGTNRAATGGAAAVGAACPVLLGSVGAALPPRGGRSAAGCAAAAAAIFRRTVPPMESTWN